MIFRPPRLTDVTCPGECAYCTEHFHPLDQTDWTQLTERERARMILGHARHHLGPPTKRKPPR